MRFVSLTTGAASNSCGDKVSGAFFFQDFDVLDRSGGKRVDQGFEGTVRRIAGVDSRLQGVGRRDLKSGSTAGDEPNRLLGFVVTRVRGGYNQLPISLPERQDVVATRNQLGHELQGVALRG